MAVSIHSQMHSEIRRIGQKRFASEYWSSIETALESYSSQHSRVICNSNGQIAAFILVCPPQTSSHSKYGLEGKVPSSFYEIAFLATDEGNEGRGYARLLLSAVLQCCTENSHNVWLHVDSINPRAVALYESLGFQSVMEIPDPFGSYGYLMVRLCSIGWNSKTREGFALLNTSPSQAEHTFGGSIFPPPCATCC